MSSDQIESELRSIEHALHAALVRQLRVISLMAVLLGVAGYFVGHFVADEQHRGAAAAPAVDSSAIDALEGQIAELQAQLHHQVSAVAERCDRQETAHSETLAALHELEALRRDDAARDAAAINALLADIENRRSMSLRELEAHVARRVAIPPEAVTAAINRFVDGHVLQLDRALSVVERRLSDKAIAETRAPAPPTESFTTGNSPTSSTPATLSNPAPATLAPPRVAATPQVARNSSFFAPPQRKPLLFLSPKQPKRLDPVRISESDEIPLPPR